MLQVLQSLGNGQTMVVNVPAPGPRPGKVLVETRCTLISAGTERMLVDFGRAGWLGKIRRQPEKVRAVLDKVRSNGVLDTIAAVRSKLNQPIPLGYCHVGRVVDPGELKEFSPSQRVVSSGPHAEVISVAPDVCARIPDRVSDEAAAFTPLCSIGLQGIELLAPKAGDQVVVTGLGLIGQLSVRILKAMECEVLGFDPSPERRKLAEDFGAATADGDPVAAALSWSRGRGVAGVLITASSASHEIVGQAARSCGWRGKVVLVGVVGLHINRADFYQNEISFQVSCSYGVRDLRSSNSVRRNFDRVLRLMEEGKLTVSDLITHRFALEHADEAYASLDDRSALGIVLTYPETRPDRFARSVVLRSSPGSEPEAVGLIGAGNFAIRTLLPALKQLPVSPPIAAIAARSGSSAFLAAKAFSGGEATTAVARVLSNPGIGSVFISTRHDAHAEQVIAALAAGKHVWVEKPLAIKQADLDVVIHAARTSERVLMVGFNRRFAPMAVALKESLKGFSGRVTFRATINAGRLPADHWTLDPDVGGGRIVGEACHFVDLMRYWAGTPIEKVTCLRRDADGQDGGCFELQFRNARGVIDYRTDLPASYPKETLRIEGQGFEASIDNWARLRSRGLNGLRMGLPWSKSARKGHREALIAFLSSVRTGRAPVALSEIEEVSRTAIKMQAV